MERANEEDERQRRLRVVGGPRSEQPTTYVRAGWSLLASLVDYLEQLEKTGLQWDGNM